MTGMTLDELMDGDDKIVMITISKNDEWDVLQQYLLDMGCTWYGDNNILHPTNAPGGAVTGFIAYYIHLNGMGNCSLTYTDDSDGGRLFIKSVGAEYKQFTCSQVLNGIDSGTQSDDYDHAMGIV